MADSLSNSDILRKEKEAFSNVSLPLERPDDADGGELPFIVGVIDDLAGNAPGKPRADLSDRKFDKVSRYTLNDKIAEINPGLEYDVRSTLPETLGGTGDSIHVKLRFDKMKDFEPKNVAEQVPALNKLLKLREQLQSLKARASSDPELRKELEKLIAGILEKNR